MSAFQIATFRANVTPPPGHPLCAGWMPPALGITDQLYANGIILGAHIFNPGVQDSANSFVYKQRPTSKTEDGKPLRMRAGQMVDVWLQTERPVTDSAANSMQFPLPQE